MTPPPRAVEVVARAVEGRSRGRCGVSRRDQPQVIESGEVRGRLGLHCLDVHVAAGEKLLEGEEGCVHQLGLEEMACQRQRHAVEKEEPVPHEETRT